MLVTLAMVVFFSSVGVFFSEEFGRFFKKVIAIPGAKLLLPLVAASLVVEMFEGLGQWVMVRCQAVIHQLIFQVSKVIPFESVSLTVVRILYLFLVGSLPIWIFRLRAKQKGQRQPQVFAYRLGLLLWIIAAILLTVA
ncbi:MAG: hypothetical protein NTW94_00820 [Legionellales bacterium]|nr:hypothetical protein [Legionellales bacterium]